MAQMQGSLAQDIRRHPDGSIDIDFYRKQTIALRSAAMQGAFKLKAGGCGLVLATAAALAFVTVVASLPRYAFVASASNAATAGVADLDRDTLARPVGARRDHVEALINSRKWWEGYGKRPNPNHVVAMAD